MRPRAFQASVGPGNEFPHPKLTRSSSCRFRSVPNRVARRVAPDSHPIRHAGASTLDYHNVPMGSIQRILGHENRTTTEIYLHSIAESEREAMNVFEQAREKSHTKSHTEPGEQMAGQGGKGGKVLYLNRKKECPRQESNLRHMD